MDRAAGEVVTEWGRGEAREGCVGCKQTLFQHCGEALQATVAPCPAGWTEVPEEGGSTYYVETASGLTTRTHPLDQMFKQVNARPCNTHVLHILPAPRTVHAPVDQGLRWCAFPLAFRSREPHPVGSSTTYQLTRTAHAAGGARAQAARGPLARLFLQRGVWRRARRRAHAAVSE